MRKRPLGKTGLIVSELALGTWGLSGDAYGPVAELEVTRVVERALAQGIDIFDTADAYARGEMERRLGQILPSDARIITKVGTDLTSAPPRKRFDKAYLERAIDASAERLQRSQIDVVLLHNPSEATFRTGEAQQYLGTLKHAGRIRAWGVSAGSVRVARQAIVAGAEVIELAYNALWSDDLHELAADLSAHEVALVARSVLAHGLLAGHWSRERTFSPPDHRADRWKRTEFEDRIRQLDALRPLVGGAILTLRSVALRYVLANQLVAAAVLGPRSVAQLDELVREAGEPPYLSDAALSDLSSRVTKLA